MTDRLIRVTTPLADLAVAGVAAIISHQHAYELVSSHGESGVTARLLPFATPRSTTASSGPPPIAKYWAFVWNHGTGREAFR